MTAPDWFGGDFLGVPVPAHAQALRAGGAAYLTRAFRATGLLGPANRVAAITQFEPCGGGSTGSKLLLSVAYASPRPELPTALFVKFSRDFSDPIRDRAKNQLEAEVRLALLSRSPGFPIAVPQCCFADYHRESGTGVLITQRIAYGSAGIEPAYAKCRDYLMPEPLVHYQALLAALARLAGAQQSGRLAGEVARLFPFDAEQAIATDRIRYDLPRMQKRLERYADFAARHPGLLPPHIAAPAFIEKLQREVPRFLARETALRRFLHSQPDFIALCHWNANVDNAWFWRNDAGMLECGLLDWGRVGQMSLALALFGALSAAETELWDRHLRELLEFFVLQLRKAGGPALDVEALELHLLLFVALMGLAWLMDAPALVQAQLPQLADIRDRFDSRLVANETARVQLHMLTNVLNLWQKRDFGALLDRFEARAGTA